MRNFNVRQLIVQMMREGLSPDGAKLKSLCQKAAEAAASSIREMAGSRAAAEMVRMGADGTPTKSIDRAAEDAVLDTLRASGLGFRVLSEEAGEALIGDGEDYFLHLDPLDGTFNAIAGIPFYSVSIYASQVDFHFGYICDLFRGTAYYAESGTGSLRGAWRAAACLHQRRSAPFQHICLYPAAPYREDRLHRGCSAAHSHFGQHQVLN